MNIYVYVYCILYIFTYPHGWFRAPSPLGHDRHSSGSSGQVRHNGINVKQMAARNDGMPRSQQVKRSCDCCGQNMTKSEKWGNKLPVGEKNVFPWHEFLSTCFPMSVEPQTACCSDVLFIFPPLTTQAGSRTQDHHQANHKGPKTDQGHLGNHPVVFPIGCRTPPKSQFSKKHACNMLLRYWKNTG